MAKEPQPAKNFDFSQALSLMRQGKKVTRASWKDHRSLYIDPTYKWRHEDKDEQPLGCIIINIPGQADSRFALHELDILASDWQETV